jgi:hypothetical protein
MGQSVFVPDGFGSPAFVRDLLQKWLDLLEFYENSGQEPDVAYWYGEVSLTGLLAAAAWKLEAGWSLLEFGAKVRRCSGKRCACGDLWVGRGADEATVEAKLVWPDRKISGTRVEMQLNAARTQLHALKKTYRTGTPITVCYVVPWYKGPDGETLGKKALMDLAAWAQSNDMATATHRATIAETQPKSRSYPGVLLIARQESWPQKKSAIKSL